MIIEEDGRFMSQRKFPTMALIVPTVSDELLCLNAPGMPTLKIDRKPQVENSKVINCRYVRSQSQLLF